MGCGDGMLAQKLAQTSDTVIGLECDDIGVPVRKPCLSLAEIRSGIASKELPGVQIRRGIYYRYLLRWRCEQGCAVSCWALSRPRGGGNARCGQCFRRSTADFRY